MNSYIINVPTENGKETIDCNDILYIESKLQFSRITLLDNKTVELYLTLQEIEFIIIEQGFFNLNNRLLVNLKYVEVVFPSNASKIIMENGKEIFVSYDKREELFESLKKVYELHELV